MSTETSQPVPCQETKAAKPVAKTRTTSLPAKNNTLRIKLPYALIMTGLAMILFSLLYMSIALTALLGMTILNSLFSLSFDITILIILPVTGTIYIATGLFMSLIMCFQDFYERATTNRSPGISRLIKSA